MYNKEDNDDFSNKKKKKKKTCKGVLVSKCLTIYMDHLWETHVETATR